MNIDTNATGNTTIKLRTVVGGIIVILLLITIGWLSYTYFASREPHPIASIQLCAPSTIVTAPHPIRMDMLAADPKIITLRNFLTPDECDHLIQWGESQGLGRSTVQGGQGNEISTVRTSHTLNFKRNQDAIISALELRASMFCPQGVDHIENLQLVRYQPGQQYKHHYDFFVPGADGTSLALRRGGQRYITLFVYLNDMDPEETGAQTDFPKLGLRIKPEKGMAVLWYNMKHGKEDFRTFHAGLPPLKSTKYGLNIWVRERPFF